MPGIHARVSALDLFWGRSQLNPSVAVSSVNYPSLWRPENHFVFLSYYPFAQSRLLRPFLLFLLSVFCLFKGYN